MSVPELRVGDIVQFTVRTWAWVISDDNRYGFPRRVQVEELRTYIGVLVSNPYSRKTGKPKSRLCIRIKGAEFNVSRDDIIRVVQPHV